MKLDEIDFKDDLFKECVIATGAENAEDVTELRCRKQNIKNVAGIEYLTNLKLLDLTRNELTAVVPSKGAAIKSIACETVKIGDLEDLENLAKENEAELVIGNSHAAESASRLGLPLLRAGFPQYDLIGGYQRVWIGYQGTKQTLFDIANIMMNNNHYHEVSAYYSFLKQQQKQEYLM